jgi:beta-glucosidase
MVLLKNARRVLPLRRGSIAVIGPDADNISAQGGGSSENTHPTMSVSPLQGIRAAAGGRTVTYAPGVDGISVGELRPGAAPVPASVLSPAAGSTAQGLSAQYWSNTTFSGAPHLTQVDPNVNVNFGFQNFPGFNAASPKIPTVRGDFALLGDLSARWNGVLTAPATATYTLGLTARGDATLYVDDQPFVHHTGDLSSVGRRLALAAGQQVAIRIEYAAPALNSYQGGQVRLFWQHPESVMAPKMQQAVAAARTARTAVVVVRDYETEGFDRPSLALPKEQEQLIRRVAAVNRRTVVVVETGAVSRISPWIRGVRGAVQAWYPGQEQGNAIADVLFGRVNPSGHLPATLPRDERQVPAIHAGVAPFSEGILVGYRGFLRRHVHPSRPFGFGLSYTRFRYSGLRAHRVRGGVAVTFRVHNVGRRAGIDVPQVYTGPLPGIRSARQLAGFKAVRVGAGRTRTVRIVLPRESFSHWSASRDRWVTAHGRVPVRLAHSATQVTATRTVLIRR